MNPTEQQNSATDRGPSVELATLARGDTSELRIEWAEFKGFKYVSLRQWNKAEDGSMRPDTKRGISLKRREIKEVIEALHKALELAGGAT